MRQRSHTLGLAGVIVTTPKKKDRRKKPLIKETRTCVRCFKPFEVHPNLNKLTCSSGCAEIRHREQVKEAAAGRAATMKTERNRLRDALACFVAHADTEKRWGERVNYLAEGAGDPAVGPSYAAYVKRCNEFYYEEADRILAIVDSVYSGREDEACSKKDKIECKHNS